MKRLPPKLTIDIDTREKNPLRFPASVCVLDGSDWRTLPVSTHRVTLSFGDYRLSEYPHLLVAERKGSVSELASNLLTDDYARTRRSLERLALGCHYPFILLEENTRSFLSDSTANPDHLLQRLGEALCTHGLHFLLIGSLQTPSARLNAGRFLLNLMIGAANEGRVLGVPPLSKKFQETY